MLTHLRIKNLALAADLALELQPGFNAITGETGAGKSILIGALNLLLGQRADRTLIRSGCDSCAVEAVLDVSRMGAPLGLLLSEGGVEPCEGGQLLLRRTFSNGGTNRQFINGSPVALHTLASVGDLLVDIHGPHDHQSLFHPARQLELLDAFGGLESGVTRFAEAFDERAGLEAEKAALVVDEATYARQLDLLRYQLHEITAAQLHPGEETTIEQEHERARNSARLVALSQEAASRLSENDDALLTQAGSLGRTLHELERVDPAAAPLAELLHQATETLRELQSQLSHYVDRIDLDPARLQELEDRLNLLQGLRRKYGSTVADILAFADDAQTRLDQLESRDTELTRINAAIARTETEIRESGLALAKARKGAIPRLSKAVEAQLQDLGFRQSRFGAELRAAPQPQRSGLDVLDFQFAPNPGEASRSLRAIASSGELARVMLALKTVLAAQDNVPVLVFDEVDANVGGETAHAVGQKMREIGRRRQVLCITHLAPVAAAAASHLVVLKSERGGRTLSEITSVSDESRILELARMLGGGAAARAHAEALLTESSRR